MLPIKTNNSDWGSIYIAGCCAFIQATQFAIFFSSMWPYILTLDPDVKQSSFGIIVSLYSFAQAICCPVFGYWSNKLGQVRIPLIVGFCIMAMGNLTYMCLQFLPGYHIFFMMAARFIAGGGTGNMGLLRAYASTASTSKDRSRAIACVSGGIAVGSMIGPALQIIFTPLGAQGIKVLGFTFSIYTAPAVLCLALNLVGLAVVKFLFVEKYIEEVKKNRQAEDGETENEEDKSCKIPSPDIIAILVLVFTRFTQIFLVTTMESIGSAYSMMMFSFEKEEAVSMNALSHTVAGTCAATLYILFLFTNLRKILRVRLFTILALCVALVWIISTYSFGFYSENVKLMNNGSDANCDIQKYYWCDDLTQINIWVYYIGSVLNFGIAYSFLNITATTLYSKIVGARPQGTYQGIYQMSGSFGRLVAPLVMSATYTFFGPKIPWQILMANLTFVIVIWIVFKERLVPFEKSKFIDEKMTMKRVSP